MTISKEVKELTPQQYDFYKTQLEPLPDSKIMKLHGMNHNSLNAFKKEHNLMGKYPRTRGGWQKNNSNNLLFENKKPEEPKSSGFKPGPANPKLLKENDIPKERVKKVEKQITGKPVQIDAPILTEKDVPAIAKRIMDKIDAQVAEIATTPYKDILEGEQKMTAAEAKALVPAIKIHPGNDKIGDFKLEDEQIPSGNLKALKTNVSEDLDYLPPIDWYNDRHTADTEKIHRLEMELKVLEKERYQEYLRANSWCDRFRDMEKENSELKAERSKQDAALVKHSKDELLVTMMANKLADFGGRLVEGAE